MGEKMTFKCMIDNVLKEFEILYTFRSINTNKDYIIYTDNTYYNNELNIYAAIYYPNLDKELENIESEKDWQEVTNFLEKIRGGSNE